MFPARTRYKLKVGGGGPSGDGVFGLGQGTVSVGSSTYNYRLPCGLLTPMQTLPSASAPILASGPFDLVAGLPVHALVVHVAVVILPLAALGFVIAVLVPRTRKALAAASVIGLGVGTLAAIVARQSGEALAARMGDPGDHAQWGNILPLVALVTFALALGWFWTQRGAGHAALRSAFAAGAVAMSVLALALTVVVGHSGATAVWSDAFVASDAPAAANPPVELTAATTTTTTSSAPSTSTSAAGPAAAPAKSIALSTVAKHNTRNDCWAAINGSVYNLTNWVGRHPGGARRIVAICGTDASAAFNNQHSGSAKAKAALRQFRIGALA